LTPQRLKAGVHFGRDRTRVSARRGLARPETGRRKFFVQIFENRQRFPNAHVAVDQYRHLAGTRDCLHARLEVGGLERNQGLLKWNARDLHGEPWPERP
jgi:hypothetical protein